MGDPNKEKKKGKIIVFIGLPASGKSTEARSRMDDGNIMRVNRDDLRSMLFKRWKGKKEGVVTGVEKAAVRSAVLSGFDIIIDDTNLNPGTRASWKTLANELGVVLVEESFETPLLECVKRDALRTGKAHVGRSVIENMALTYGILPKLAPEQKVVIFDVDGTLVDCSHRKVYLNVCKNCNEIEEFHQEPAVNECELFVPGKKNHKIFYAKCIEDTPIYHVIKWAQACHEAGYYVIIVSGRPTDLAGDATVASMAMHGVPYQHLFMRAGGDYSDDTRVKQEILDRILKWIPKEQILFTVDDRPRVIRMWKANGIKCYDVGEGIEF